MFTPIVKITLGHNQDIETFHHFLLQILKLFHLEGFHFLNNNLLKNVLKEKNYSSLKFSFWPGCENLIVYEAAEDILINYFFLTAYCLVLREDIEIFTAEFSHFLGTKN